MIVSKTVIALAAASMVVAIPAFAQSAGTTATGMTNGMQGTPGQPSPSTTGTPMKSSGTMMKSNGGMMNKSPAAMEDKPAAADVAPGGVPNKN